MRPSHLKRILLQATSTRQSGVLCSTSAHPAHFRFRWWGLVLPQVLPHLLHGARGQLLRLPLVLRIQRDLAGGANPRRFCYYAGLLLVKWPLFPSSAPSCAYMYPVASCHSCAVESAARSEQRGGRPRNAMLANDVQHAEAGGLGRYRGFVRKLANLEVGPRSIGAVFTPREPVGLAFARNSARCFAARCSKADRRDRSGFFSAVRL